MNDTSSAAHCRQARFRQRHRGDRKGTAVMEFALIAPIFFVMVFGMIEYGRMVMAQQILTAASREGARAAILEGSTTDAVTTEVTNYLSGASITGATVTVSPDPPSTAGFGQPVTVTVTVPFSAVSWLPTPMYLGATTLTSSTAMRRETLPP